MAETNGTGSFWADLARYCAYESHAHTPAHALEGLQDADLAYSPIPEVALSWQDEWRAGFAQTPRRLLTHMIWAARMYGNGLIGERGDVASEEWIPRHLGGVADSADGLRGALSDELQLLIERVATLSDADLAQPSTGVWDDAVKGFVVLDGAILHTAWHLGQIAMLIDWRQAEAAGHVLAPPAGPPGRYRWPGDRDWASFAVGTRKDALLRLADAAFSESPWHALRRVVQGMTEHELAWRPFPEIDNPWFCRAMWTLVLHTWSPKIVYIDHGLGERTLDYGPSSDAIAGCGWGETRPEKQLAALDRAQQWLVDHVSAATEEDLDRVNPMHINHPMAGWQVVACMAQHDAWHAGQLSLMRDVYAALWNMRQP